MLYLVVIKSAFAKRWDYDIKTGKEEFLEGIRIVGSRQFSSDHDERGMMILFKLYLFTQKTFPLKFPRLFKTVTSWSMANRINSRWEFYENNPWIDYYINRSGSGKEIKEYITRALSM